MKIKSKFAALILMLLCINGNIWADDATKQIFKMPDIIPLSPEAASLGKYGDIPIGEYTGIPSISIPLYTIKEGDIEVPINLSYHASGIKVAQEATWVGLGWDLIAGGCVSGIAVGKKDAEDILADWSLWNETLSLLPQDHGGQYAGFGFPRTFSEGYYIKQETNGSQSLCYTPLKDIYRESVGDGIGGSSQRDIYSFNFLNYSFKAIIHPKDKHIVFAGEKNKCKVERFSSGSTQPTWKVTDENGIVYIFNEKQYTSGVSTAYDTPSTWYLSQITSPDGKWVKFNYSESVRYSFLPRFQEKIRNNYPYSYDPWISIDNTENQATLASIETENVSVVFKTKSRVDIPHGVALDSIKIVNKVNGSILNSYKFNYDYFIGNDIGGNFLSTNNLIKSSYLNKFTDDNIRKRLKLISVSKTVGNDSQIHSFTYNESNTLPCKTSFAMDYWGYYNGQNNSTFIPDIDLMLCYEKPTNISNDIYHKFVSGSANRSASDTYSTVGMLQSITYPTGGKTSFEFEPHSFANYHYPDATKMKEAFITGNMTINRANYDSYDSYYPNQTFTLTSKSLVTLNLSIHGPDYVFDDFDGCYASLLQIALPGPIFTQEIDLKIESLIYDQRIDFDADGHHTVTLTMSKILPAGLYTFSAGLPSKVVNKNAPGNMPNGLNATVSYIDINKAYIDQLPSIGGGVRIKKITNRDTNGSILSTNEYSYTNSDGTNSGKLICPLQFWKYQQVHYTLPNSAFYRDMDVIEVNSNNFINLSPAFDGTTVGYDQVNVVSKSLTGQNNGKTSSFFVNNSAITAGIDMAWMDKTGNGQLTKKLYFNANQDTVRTEYSEYDKTDEETEYLNFNIYDNEIPSTFSSQTGSDYIPNFEWEYQDQAKTVLKPWWQEIANYMYGPESLTKYKYIMTYPNVSYWTHLSKRTETDYFGTSKITKATSYKYNPSNYQVSEVSEQTSDGHQRRTVMKYPVDFTTSFPYPYPYSTMIDRNMIAPVVENSIFKDSNFLERVRTNYWFQSTGVIKPSIVESQIGNQTTKIRLQYAQYDAKYNPVCVIQNEAINIVYLWSYNYQYPVAKIEGLPYSDVVNALTQNFIDNLSTSSVPTNDQLNKIRTKLADKTALVTTFTYKPLVGITSVTDPHGVTTNYTYDTFNRLYLTRNDDKNIVGKYRYSYQSTPDNGQGGYSGLTASVSTGATNYIPGANGAATLSGISGGSNSYSYNWYLKNNSDVVLASSLDTDSNSFSFTCSESGILKVICLVTDDETGQTVTATQTIPCYNDPTASVTIGASYYMLNSMGSATVAPRSGSGNYSYSWYLNGTPVTGTNTFNFTALTAGVQTIKCIVTDNVTGKTAQDTQTVTCYNVPTASVSIGATYYMLNRTGSATISAGSGSGNFSYAWSLKDSSGAVLQTGTSSSFSYTCSQAGTLTVQCIVTDNTTGQTATDSKTVICYTAPAATVTVGATYYKINDTGSATVAATGGSGNYYYSWLLKNSDNVTLQTGTNSLQFSFNCSQSGPLTIVCTVVDKLTGQTTAATQIVPCYSLPEASVSIDAPFYLINAIGTARVAISGGYGNFTYSWMSTNRAGVVTQLGTSNPINFSCSQSDTLTVQCVIINQAAGQVTFARQTVPYYSVPTASISNVSAFYMLNGTGAATIAINGGSKKFAYNWTLTDISGNILQRSGSSSFNFTCSQTGQLVLQCVVTDYVTGQTTTDTKTVICYAVPTASVTIGASYYMLNGTGSATVASGSGSGNFSYAWSLKNSSGAVLQTATTSSFSYTCSQAGTLTVQCVITDNTTGKTATDSKTVACYYALTGGGVSIGSPYYMLNATGIANVYYSSNSGSVSYNWSLRNSSGTVLQTSTANSFNYTCSQAGTLTVQCVVTDNITGLSISPSQTVACYTYPTASVAIGASYYMFNGTGSATVAAGNGSGNFSYAWSLKNSSGAVLQTSTSSSFSYTCSQAGTLAVQCVVTDNVTGQTSTDSKMVPCYNILAATLTTNTTEVLNVYNSAAVSTTGGSGNLSYNWYLKNSAGTTLQSSLNSTWPNYTFKSSQTGTVTLQCVVIDNITGQSVSVSQSATCYSLPSPIISTGTDIYRRCCNSSGTATVSTTGGSGGFTYSWYLKNSAGTVLQSSLNTTSTQFNFTLSAAGSFALVCIATDNVTGESATATRSVTCYDMPVISVVTQTSAYTDRSSASSTASVTGGSGSYTYSWYAKNTSGTVYLSQLNSTQNTFGIYWLRGTTTIQCNVTDNITGLQTFTSKSYTIQ